MSNPIALRLDLTLFSFSSSTLRILLLFYFLLPLLLFLLIPIFSSSSSSSPCSATTTTSSPSFFNCFVSHFPSYSHSPSAQVYVHILMHQLISTFKSYYIFLLHHHLFFYNLFTFPIPLNSFTIARYGTR